MAEEQQDHDRIIRVEADLAALDRFVAEQRKNLNEALERSTTSLERRFEQISDAQVKLAERSRTEATTQRDVLAASLKAEVDKIDQQISILNTQIAELKVALVPRAELKILLDAVASKQESITKAIFDVAQNIATLRSSIAGQREAKTDIEGTSRWNRDHIVAILAVVVAAIAIIVSIYYGVSVPNTHVHNPPTTISTTG